MMVDTELLGALRMGTKRGNVTTFPFSSLNRPENLGSPAILELSWWRHTSLHIKTPWLVPFWLPQQSYKQHQAVIQLRFHFLVSSEHPYFFLRFVYLIERVRVHWCVCARGEIGRGGDLRADFLLSVEMSRGSISGPMRSQYEPKIRVRPLTDWVTQAPFLWTHLKALFCWSIFVHSALGVIQIARIYEWRGDTSWLQCLCSSNVTRWKARIYMHMRSLCWPPLKKKKK